MLEEPDDRTPCDPREPVAHAPRVEVSHETLRSLDHRSCLAFAVPWRGDYASDMPRAESEILDLDGHEVTITNPGKVFFPDAGITKIDLVRYYLAVADGALLGVRTGRWR